MEDRVKADFFQDEEHQGVFTWMLEFWDKYNASPTEEALHHEFPNFKLIETPEPYDYYIDELRNSRCYAMLVDTLDDLRDPLEKYDTELAVKILARSINDIQQEVANFNIVDFAYHPQERLEYYNSLTELEGGMRGIPTGFPTMDFATSGLQPEQLVTLVGLPKAGKSVFLMHMNIAAHNYGRRPLGITFEMSNLEQQTRHDAFRAHISHNRLITGKLKPLELRKLKDMLKAMESMPEMLWVHDPSSTTTVSAIKAQVAQYKPDVLFVDGVYLMDCEIPNVQPGSAQALTSITRGLKRLAQQAKIPVVCTTQVLPGKYSARRGLEMDMIGYTSSFAQDSDVIFGVEHPKDGEDNEVLLKIVAARNASRKIVRVSWDWETGTMEELEEEEFDFGRDDGDED